MNLKSGWFITMASVLWLATSLLSADQLEMVNGDRYRGYVLSVNAGTVVLDSDLLGKITLPRALVARMAFGTNSVACPALPPQLSAAAKLTQLAAALTNGSLTTLSPPLNPNGSTGTNANTSTELVRQIREQMLTGSPAATAKYNELVNGLLSGQVTVSDLQQQARESAEEIREMKKTLGPDADDALDGYLEILDGFVKAAGTNSTGH